MRTRDKPVLIYLSSDEFARLEEMAFKAKLSRSEFIREFIRDVKLKEAPTVDYYNLIREVRRIGNNVHQLLVLANAKGLIITNDLRKYLDEIYQLEKIIRSAYDEEKQ